MSALEHTTRHGIHAVTTALVLLALGVALVRPADAASDPTRPAQFQAPAQEATAPPRIDWELTSTLVSPGRRVAVINGERVVRGGRVRGARVVAIEPGRVVLERDGRRFEISLAARSIKRASEPATYSPGEEQDP